MAHIDVKVRTFTAGEALVKNRLVKLNSAADTVNYCDAGETPIGVVKYDAANAADVSVQMLNFGGTYEIEAAGAITALATIYTAADGKIDDTATGSKLGSAIFAATASGDVIEIAPFTGPEGGVSVHAHTADASGGATLTGTTLAAAGDITLADTSNIITNATTGSNIGAATTQKLAFWAATPIVQLTHNADPAAASAITATQPGSGADGTTPNGAEWTAAVADLGNIKTNLDALKASIDAINADFASLGLTAAS